MKKVLNYSQVPEKFFRGLVFIIMKLHQHIQKHTKFVIINRYFVRQRASKQSQKMMTFFDNKYKKEKI